MMKKAIAALALCFAAHIAHAAVDINKATEAELDSVKGLGPGTTKLILEQRKSGSFKNWDDVIDRVKGIGPAKASKLSAEGLTVAGEPFKPAAGKPKGKADAKPAAEPVTKEAKK
jgi:competence protein ComEA